MMMRRAPLRSAVFSFIVVVMNLGCDAVDMDILLDVNMVDDARRRATSPTISASLCQRYGPRG